MNETTLIISNKGKVSIVTTEFIQDLISKEFALYQSEQSDTRLQRDVEDYILKLCQCDRVLDIEEIQFRIKKKVSSLKNPKYEDFFPSIYG